MVNIRQLPLKVFSNVKWNCITLMLCTLTVFILLKLCMTTTILKEFQYGTSTLRIKSQAISRHENEILYGIMFDAGSTGSRIHVYKFSQRLTIPILLNEIFEQVKPGLSSYAKQPEEGAESIKKLLSIAQNKIPQKLWSSTKLALKATAGLRLLPPQQADHLLDEVHKLFQASSFLLPSEPVAIMNGIDEGIYSWITTNYLLNRFSPCQNQFTVGIIDLGGGSMQITFAPHEMQTLVKSQSDHIVNRSVFGSNITLYSQSYLGLGLMSARESVLKASPKRTTRSTTSCIPDQHKCSWKNGQNQYEIEGIGGGYEACRKSVQSVVAGNFHLPSEIKHRTFYIFSYFFDRAVETKLVEANKGGIVTVQSFTNAAIDACSKLSVDEQSPFLCMDMTLLVTFLEDGYGFDKTTELISVNKINGKETSWTLGATFSLFNQ